ncbi:hypothetical protein E2C01_045806 [Portunus trituberculatus]|uniref:Uncharacterized protein n=1 Tax=Portunus trituberculatus TaxID=210409 RepID=A0A5B7G301_PORTR|nr:hypothetical protein [Portunus trituberculatus]
MGKVGKMTSKHPNERNRQNDNPAHEVVDDAGKLPAQLGHDGRCESISGHLHQPGQHHVEERVGAVVDGIERYPVEDEGHQEELETQYHGDEAKARRPEALQGEFVLRRESDVVPLASSRQYLLRLVKLPVHDEPAGRLVQEPAFVRRRTRFSTSTSERTEKIKND